MIWPARPTRSPSSVVGMRVVVDDFNPRPRRRTWRYVEEPAIRGGYRWKFHHQNAERPTRYVFRLRGELDMVSFIGPEKPRQPLLCPFELRREADAAPIARARVEVEG